MAIMKSVEKRLKPRIDFDSERNNSFSNEKKIICKEIYEEEKEEEIGKIGLKFSLIWKKKTIVQLQLGQNFQLIAQNTSNISTS